MASVLLFNAKLFFLLLFLAALLIIILMVFLLLIICGTVIIFYFLFSLHWRSLFENGVFNIRLSFFFQRLKILVDNLESIVIWIILDFILALNLFLESSHRILSRTRRINNNHTFSEKIPSSLAPPPTKLAASKAYIFFMLILHFLQLKRKPNIVIVVILSAV